MKKALIANIETSENRIANVIQKMKWGVFIPSCSQMMGHNASEIFF
jgi:hypothetical protein